MNFGGNLGFEFEFAHKLQMATQWKALFILRVDVSSYQLHMNPESFEVLVASSMFDRLPKETQELLNILMSTLAEIASDGGLMAP